MNITDCIAIDPGSETSGLLVMSSGKVANASQDLPPEAVERVVRTWSFLPVLIEGLSNYGQQIGDETLRTAYVIGKLYGIDPSRTTVIRRIDVKLALVGASGAKDSVIRQDLLERFGGPAAAKKGGPLSTVKGHAWQALALACAWEVMKANGGVKAYRMP